MTNRTDQRIGFLGAGRMATALAKGLVSSGFTQADRIIAGDVMANARDQFAESTGARCVESNKEVIDTSDVIVVAVKPQHVGSLLDAIGESITADHLVVSIAAGVSLERIGQSLPDDSRIVRVMPNTPCLVGAGASAYALASNATPDDGQFVEQMLSTVGRTVEVPESLLDAVTGLSGSGPAYAFEMIEALSDGGVRVGLPRTTATMLAAQTLLGAAKMVLDTQEHPAALKDAVASPGGTTIAGLHALERGSVRAALMDAVVAATERSRELSDG